MKVRLPYIVQDQLTAMRKGFEPVERFDYESKFFLDGPVTESVAVLDFDGESGGLSASAKFEPPEKDKILGKYQVNENAISSREFNQVSVFATVVKTMRMFERPDVIGRKIVWAFDAPQLLIVPRAGEMANAYYERESHSLQFFYFNSETTSTAKRLYSSLSHDIVTHEAAHAIFDGIAPDLYNAITPQSLALHEAISDLTAFVMSVDSPTLRTTVLEQTRGELWQQTAFSRVAEEFGGALEHGRGYLRSLWNQKTLIKNDKSVDQYGEPNRVSHSEPHDLSQVLTGALYAVFINSYKEIWNRRFSDSGKALIVSMSLFRRIIFRALDYLPPGDVSFADYGRAALAADEASHPYKNRERSYLKKEFVRRGIVKSEKYLDVRTNYSSSVIALADLESLMNSDWVAYDFANKNRRLLKIPDNTPFRVLTRIEAVKTSYHREGERETRELIFKVAWKHEEVNDIANSLPGHRVITIGTSLVIDMDSHKIRALLTTENSASQRLDRDDLLSLWWEEGLLNVGQPSFGNGAKRLPSQLDVQVTNDVIRIKGAARTMHIAPV